ncbi:MAG: hypothetical protein HWN66_01820 [Candidatus Helarchaeota archaeon]|nr:hypothetical protein [Candidatus Helarchaeota archaeon]
MKRKQVGFFGAVLIIILFCILPVNKTASGSRLLEVGDDHTIYYYLSESVVSISGTYSANYTIDVFVTDNATHRSMYISTGYISDDVLWKKASATNGDCSAMIVNTSATHYVVLGNHNGTLDALVQYDITAQVRSSGIPGFEFIFACLTLLAILGLAFLKKQSLL